MTKADDNVFTPAEVATLERLLAKLAGPGADLPWPLFRFVNEVVATVNVDLVVTDPDKGVLLAWRDDPFGTGWHVPGSIVRHREEIGHRIAACAIDEFGCEIDVVDRASAVIQIFDDRGHSVSLCYRATLAGEPGRRLVSDDQQPEPGDLRWFKVPSAADLYPSHLVYGDMLVALARGDLDGGAPLFTQHVGERDAAQATPEGMIAADTEIA